MFCRLIRRLPSTTPVPTPFNTKCLHAALSVFLFTASLYKRSFSVEESYQAMADEKVVRCFAQVKKSLRDEWIVSYFSPVFGTPSINQLFYMKAKADVQVSF